MKLCFLCNEYPPVPHGGIGSVVQLVGRALVRTGHQVRVVGAYRQSEPERTEDDHGVEVCRLKMPERRLGWTVARYRLFSRVADWARRGEIDLVEVPDYQGWAAGWGQLPVPVVARLHGSGVYFAAEMGWKCDRLGFWLERASLRRCDFIGSTSRYTAERTRDVFKLKNSADAILYNPVDIPEAAPAKARSRSQVVFAGTLNSKKGVLSLIRAWPEVRRACPDSELHMFGKDTLTRDGQSMEGYLASMLNGDRGSVHFHGHTSRENLLENLKTPRVAVFPSYAEAFAMAPLEAMANGCPTIYSRRGSGPELMDDGRDGLLIDPDQPQEIAKAIIRVLRDDELAVQLGQAGRRRVAASFSAPVVLAHNEAFYISCIQKFKRRLDCKTT
jgi:glycosyltransferase involved in cell wall biosynthesis